VLRLRFEEPLLSAVIRSSDQDAQTGHRVRVTTERFEPYLDPGERILWSGRPMLRPFLEGQEIILPVVCLLLAGSIFRVLGMHDRETFNIEMMRVLMVAMMLTLGAIAIWLPLRTILRRRRSHYAVTDKRAMLLETGMGGKFRSYPLTWDRIVNVRFGTHVSVIFELERGAPYVSEIGFEHLQDGMAVYRLIRAVQTDNAR
ncbi:MAG: hypothetical protein AAF675_20175, partial [Pseudomonadota bacterium]